MQLKIVFIYHKLYWDHRLGISIRRSSLPSLSSFCKVDMAFCHRKLVFFLLFDVFFFLHIPKTKELLESESEFWRGTASRSSFQVLLGCRQRLKSDQRRKNGGMEDYW